MLELPLESMILLALICLFAGIVRGFSGFALSAVVMASASLMIPPVELIPICWWLETAASVLMLRSGWQQADRKVAITLAMMSALGVPIGITLTTQLEAASSQIVVLAIISVLALSQLFKLKIAFLSTSPGLYLSGFTAGIVTGLAHVGGMVVALYTLSTNAAANKIRASLVLFLFIGTATSMVTFIWAGVMDSVAVQRGIVFAVPTMIGVWLGTQLFRPRFAPYYRPLCLLLLIVIAVVGITRKII